jgi:uncharacterized protein (DUF2141 family)
MQKERINKRSISQKFSILWMMVLVGFIASCAQIVAPTGGKKDTTPPIVKSSYPTNAQLNFHQKQITIHFNEWMQPLTNPKAQVIISPNVEPFPKIEIIKNELSIKFKDTLQPNTTYSIYFGDNLKDNNEGNTLSNYKFLFSTGSFIDSLNVKGSVQTALDKIPDNTFVLLYKEKEDSVFTKKRPFYISKVQTDGSFSLENIKDGAYRIYALSDKNGNYYYDLPTESIAFSDSLTHVSSNIDSLNLELFLPEDTTLRIFEKDKTIKGGILHLTFNKELSFSKDELTATIIGNDAIIPIIFQDKEPKKATIYFTKLQNDSSNLTVVLKDNGKLIDTLKLKTESKNFKNPILFFQDTAAYKSLKLIESTPLKLISSFYCLEKPDSSKIKITDTSNINLPFLISVDADLQTFKIAALWKPDMKYKLTILDSALVDLAGNYNKNQEISFWTTSVKKAGNLLITYELPKKNISYIAILKDNSGKVLDKQILRDSQAVKMDYGLRAAGTYSVEVIEDVNDNGIWNSGSFIEKRLPEKIYKELKPIVVKENWDAEEIIKVDFSKKAMAPPSNPANSLPKQQEGKANSLQNNFNQERRGLFGQ